MTAKPTQAQVEAAHQAAMKKCREEGRIGPTATAITAALTAAAEVGPTKKGVADLLAVKIVTLVSERISKNGKLYAYDGIEAAREIKRLILDEMP